MFHTEQLVFLNGNLIVRDVRIEHWETYRYRYIHTLLHAIPQYRLSNVLWFAICNVISRFVALTRSILA